MNAMYDVVILGCGEAGIFAAYELAHSRPDLKVLALDQGRDIYHRSCPIVAGKVRECIHCSVCDTMCGFGGAGAFSDGKFNFTTQFGGWLTDFMDPKVVMDLIDYVDSINVAHGATTQVFSTQSDEAKALARKALGYDLHLLQARCKHLGTENNLRILQNIYEGLKDMLEFRFNTAVEHIAQADGGFCLTLAGGEEVTCKRLIAAPGRSGAEWFSNQCKQLGLELLNNQVDIGVRVELPASVFEHITDVVYESKLVYRTKQYGDQVRTFCMNPYGHVVAENVEGINTVNGHSYADPALRSENTNFALLVSNRFTQPFNEPYRYGKHIASLSNMLSGGVLVQRFGDLVGGRRTNEHRMSKSFVRPTLTAAVPGDLSLALPKRQLDDIIETHCRKHGVPVIGRLLFPAIGEYSQATVREALLGENRPYDAFEGDIPARPPVLCAGCPHRGLFYRLGKRKDIMISGDIGCYTLGASAPLSCIDACVCMGASISGLHGYNTARGKESAKKSVAVIGDSTFCHSGITGLVDIAYNKGISTVIVLDNSITGMTGHQNNPANGLTISGDPTVAIDLEALAHAIGIRRVVTVDPFDVEATRAAIEAELQVEEPSLVISRRPCALLKTVKHKPALKVIADKCTGCKACLQVGCPALSHRPNEKNGRTAAVIDPTQCVGCEVCAQACRFGAISKA